MCGRFFIDEEQNEELLKIVRGIDKHFSANNNSKQGEIYPSDTISILAKFNNELKYIPMRWGFTTTYNNKRIINARSESITQKPMFSNCIISNRIIIPASGFFEWDHTHQKNKFYFTRPSKKLLYMAGIFRPCNEENQFVILTTAANESMASIHNRMPLLMTEEEIAPWLFENNLTKSLLNINSEPLDKILISKKSAEYEQLTLPF